jgi:hypothetical protein
MSPKFKAQEMIRKHGSAARIQVDQIIALIPYNNDDKRTYWGLVIKELDHEPSNYIQR